MDFQVPGISRKMGLRQVEQGLGTTHFSMVLWVPETRVELAGTHSATLRYVVQLHRIRVLLFCDRSVLTYY